MSSKIKFLICNEEEVRQKVKKKIKTVEKFQQFTIICLQIQRIYQGKWFIGTTKAA